MNLVMNELMVVVMVTHDDVLSDDCSQLLLSWSLVRAQWVRWCWYGQYQCHSTTLSLSLCWRRWLLVWALQSWSHSWTRCLYNSSSSPDSVEPSPDLDSHQTLPSPPTSLLWPKEFTSFNKENAWTKLCAISIRTSDWNILCRQLPSK